ncbi:glycerol-3-phosphate 1-O-acyltransferase PlsY [Lutimaribacter marinistellae]|uniref:Glycerol-3-phosphate acyltransferase n=1 Tax=Lutimaribacter marinistellae TaxID=1820329 RepID=A0ABV7TGF9_9RHOB
MPLIETPVPLLLLWGVMGYLLGSIPFGIVMARLFGLGNLREIGSGNIGATNVLRTGNKPAAALTLVLDAGKGAIAVLVARAFAVEDAVQLAGFMAFLGHCFPIWLRFHGGKGVATFLGLWLAFAWPVGIACCATWLAAAGLSRISSVGALAAAVLAPVWALLLGWGSAVVMAVALALIVFWRHRANIARIMAGTEPRIGRKES